MPFECQQCGECCSHLGLVHKIKEPLGNYEFLVCNQYTGEENLVVVDPDKIHLFENRSIFNELPEACPFFRHDQKTRKAYCTVHLTRPDICRDYGCWRLLILDFRGRRAGRIMYQRYLISDDKTLTQLWEQCINKIDESDEAVWEGEMIRILTKAGYTIRR